MAGSKQDDDRTVCALENSEETVVQQAEAPASLSDDQKTVVDSDAPVLPGGEQSATGPVREPKYATDPKTFGGGRYRVVEQIGKGAFGTVYKAFDRNFDIHVAVKVANTEGIDPADLADFKLLFDREAKTARRLEHAGIVRVNDYDPEADEPYLVMSLVQGGTLHDLLKQRGPLGWEEVVDLGIQVGEALHYAHINGVHAHRDIKPANIFCTGDRGYQVGDFGIARRRKAAGSGLTQSTFFAAGTPRYMAPEQIAAPRSVDARSDLFSTAVVLYEALTGKLPYKGIVLGFDPGEDPGSAARIVETAFDTRAPIRRLKSDVPPELTRVIERALERDPDRRYESCGEFVAALRRVRGHAEPLEHIRRQRALKAAVALLVLTAGVGGAYWSWSRTRAHQMLTDARSEAAESKAQRLAAKIFAKAVETSDASLYLEAAAKAWPVRLTELRSDVAKAKERATGALAEQYAAAELVRAETEQKRADGLTGNSHEAAGSLQEAVRLYELAASKARASAERSFQTRIDAVNQFLTSVIAMSSTGPDVMSDSERIRRLVASGATALDVGDLREADARLLAAERRASELRAAIAAGTPRERAEATRVRQLARDNRWSAAIGGVSEEQLVRADAYIGQGDTAMADQRYREATSAYRDALASLKRTSRSGVPGSRQ